MTHKACCGGCADYDRFTPGLAPPFSKGLPQPFGTGQHHS